MKKRVLSLLLAAVLSVGLFCAAPMTAYAAEDRATVSISANGTITVTNGAEGSYLVTILDADGKAIGFEVVTVGADGTGTKTTETPGAAAVGHSIPSMGDPIPEVHSHSWATGWSSDPNGHWHACTANGCGITDYATCGESGAAYGGHEYTSASDNTCDTCGYVRTVETVHTHNWATAWSSDPNGHWHACTASGCDITDYASCGETSAAYGGHGYADASDTTCDTCGYVRTVTPVTGVSLNKSSASVAVGSTITLTATVTPADATNKVVTWTSSNTSIATVTNGVVSGVAAGSATITVTTVDGGKTATCSVTVTSPGIVPDSGGSGGGGGPASYSVTVDKPTGGAVKVSPTSASRGDTVTITVTPNSGYELDELTVTDRNGKEIALTNKGDGKYTFTMPAGKVTVDASFAKIQEQPPVNPFTDVAPGSYYYDAVLWAVENGITSGTSATTFSPSASCTRAQTVTFLWRAAGSPAASGTNPFTDVSPNTYYYDAVLWAVQNGITNGTSATTFSPDAVVTRGQNVTFLWRWAGSRAANQANPFTDVASDAYYYDAVLWAADEGVTAGTSATTFSPDDPCLRSQIVTFLYRYMVE